MDAISLVVGAISAGAAAALKTTAAQAVKDAYSGFVTLIKDHYRDREHVSESVDYLIKKPAAVDRRGSLENELREADGHNENMIDERVIHAAHELIRTIKSHDPETATALANFGLIQAGEFEIGTVNAVEGRRSASFEKIETQKFRIGSIGTPPQSPKP